VYEYVKHEQVLTTAKIEWEVRVFLIYRTKACVLATDCKYEKSLLEPNFFLLQKRKGIVIAAIFKGKSHENNIGLGLKSVLPANVL
jgi:hypothetical protein